MTLLATKPRQQLSVPTILAWGIALIGIALLFPRLLSFVKIASDFIAWPWQFDFTEGINLNATVELAAKHNIYRLSNPSTFVSTPYTPLFYLVTAPLTWLFGPSLAVGRIISLLATLAIAALLALAVHKVTTRWQIGILTAALWLSISPVIVWSTLYTQHLPALALGFGGLIWVMLNPKVEGIRFFIGPLLLTLAFFTKQSVIDVTAAVGIWLMLRNPRYAIRFGIATAAMIAVPFLAANLLLKGGLWEHTIANQNGLPSNDRRFNRLLARLWTEHWPLLSAALLTTAGTLIALITSLLPNPKNPQCAIRNLKSLSTPYSLASLYFLIACASVAVRLGREGVNYNHFIDCLLPACLLFGLALGWATQPRSSVHDQSPIENKSTIRNLKSEILSLPLIALILFQVLSFTDPHLWYLGPWPDPALAAKMQSWSGMVASSPGDIYSEDGYIALSNNKRLLYDDDFMFMTLARLGRWDQSTFVQSLWDRRFSLVILQQGSTRFTPEASQALDASYTLKVEDRLNIYAPNPVPSSPQFKSACSFALNSDSINYIGYSLPPGVAWNGIHPGDTLHITLYWQPTNPIANSYATYVQLLNSNGERVLGQDNPETASGQPTNQWQPNTTILDSAGLSLPTDLPPGTYTLLAGMYQNRNNTITNLTATCGPNPPSNSPLTLGTIEVK